MSNQLRAITDKYSQINNQAWELILLLINQKILTEQAGNMILQKLKDLKNSLPTTKEFVADFLSQFKEEQDKHELHTTGRDTKILVKRSERGEFIIRMYDNNYSNLKFVNE